MEKELVLCSIALTENREIAKNLYAARDKQHYLRIHDGTLFRGYSIKTLNRKKEVVYGYQVWGPDQPFRTRTKWKSALGAEKALIAEAIKLNPPPPLTKSKIKPVCPECGNDNVTLDAISRWNVQDQRWQITAILDNADCSNCMADDIKLNWIEVKDDADNSTTQSSDRTGEAVQQEPVDPADQS